MMLFWWYAPRREVLCSLFLFFLVSAMMLEWLEWTWGARITPQ